MSKELVNRALSLAGLPEITEILGRKFLFSTENGIYVGIIEGIKLDKREDLENEPVIQFMVSIAGTDELGGRGKILTIDETREGWELVTEHDSAEKITEWHSFVAGQLELL